MKTKTIFTSGTITTIALVTLVVIFVSGVLPVLALETGIGYGTYTGLGQQDIRISIMKVVRVALGLIGIITILLILYAGYLWMTSAGNADKIDQAKMTMRNAAIGLAIIFSAFAIVSFIIGALERGTIIGPPGGGPPSGGCDNCGHLGTGIIESVFPTPFSRDNPRNVPIVVTFKVEMNPDTICDIDGNTDPNADDTRCDGDPLNAAAVKIYEDALGENRALGANDVVVRSNNNLTFEFYPRQLLGNGQTNVWYATKLTNTIRKLGSNDTAFGLNSYFTWRYEIGTELDLDPVEYSNVFPQPDDEPDSYQPSFVPKASGQIVLSAQPQLFSAPEVTATSTAPVPTPTPAPTIDVQGTYNGTYEGIVRLVVSQTGAQINYSPDHLIYGGSRSVSINGSSITYGEGLVFFLSNLDPNTGSHEWELVITPLKIADTLTVGGTTFMFVDGTAAAGQISVGTTIGATAANIRAAINASAAPVTASGTGTTINITADIAGTRGNAIVISGSAGGGDWVDFCNAAGDCNNSAQTLSGGTNSDLVPTIADNPDKPRNAIIRIDFNESILPSSIVTSPTIPEQRPFIIQYNNNTTGATSTDPNAEWTTLDGQYLVSNQYRTVEFIPDNACDDDSGGALRNSCGEPMYCLFTHDPASYEPTLYRVVVKAATLQHCTGAAVCNNPDFSVCQTAAGGSGSICQGNSGTTQGVNFPQAGALAGQPSPLGIRDMASNSFNGNSNTYQLGGETLGRAEGPGLDIVTDSFTHPNQSNQSPHNLNNRASSTGDDLVWYFYVNKLIDDSAPVLDRVGPAVESSAANLSLPLDATFDELLMSSTVKPGTGYRDGVCYCDPSTNSATTGSNPGCPANHTCTVANRCEAQAGTSQVLCAADNECSVDHPTIGTPVCVNRKYVTLIDRSTRPVGWWVANNGLDTVGTPDGYADITQVFINHTRFNEATTYGGELGYGVKDSYQNCYLPGQGPQGSSVEWVCALSGVACPNGDRDCSLGDRCISPRTTDCLNANDLAAGRTYCCNGEAKNQADWLISECNTGL